MYHLVIDLSIFFHQSSAVRPKRSITKQQFKINKNHDLLYESGLFAGLLLYFEDKETTADLILFLQHQYESVTERLTRGQGLLRWWTETVWTVGLQLTQQTRDTFL